MTGSYIFPLPASFEPILERIHKNREFLLHGCGRTALEILPKLKDSGFQIAGLLDSDKNRQGQTLEGLTIHPPEHFAGTDVPVVIASPTYYFEIDNYLRKLGIYNTIPYIFTYFSQPFPLKGDFDLLLLANMAGKKRELETAAQKDILILRSVDIVITEKCSLKCRDCANLMQYFEKPIHADFDSSMRAVEHLLNSVDYVNKLNIIGGEPFMNRDLARYVEALRPLGNSFGYIIIYTNATILPSPEILAKLKGDRVIFALSDYGHNLQKIAAFEKIIEENGFLYTLLPASGWHDCGPPVLYDRGHADNVKLFNNCCAKDLLSLKDGRLFGCPRASSTASLSAAPPQEHQFVTLDSPRVSTAETREAIKKLMQLDMLKVCAYCNGRPEGVFSIPAAIQTKAPLPYRKYETE